MGGAIADAAGNAVAVDHAGVAPATDQLVDTAAPKIECICIAGSAGTRGAGEEVVFEARFSETVVLGAAPPTLTVLIGAARRSLSPVNASPGDRVDVLTFAYVVKAGDAGAVAVPANALAGDFADLAGIVADTRHPAIAFDGHDVDAAPAMVAEISVVSEPRDGVYVVGDTIALALRFDEAVVVTPSGTGPRLLLAVGEQQRVAQYRGGSGTDTLLFEYTVVRGDSDEDGIAVPANALRLPHRAAIADAVGLPASVSHPPLPAQSGHRVDGVVPVIESVQITSRPAASNAYVAGERIEVTVVFAEPVALGGTTEMALSVGTGTRVAGCSTRPSDSLRCMYVVADGDWDANGIGVAANSLVGTVTDLPGNAADLTHRALADDLAHRVFAAAPELTAGIEDLRLVAGGQMATVELGPGLRRLRSGLSCIHVRCCGGGDGGGGHFPRRPLRGRRRRRRDRHRRQRGRLGLDHLCRRGDHRPRRGGPAERRLRRHRPQLAVWCDGRDWRPVRTDAGYARGAAP